MHSCTIRASLHPTLCDPRQVCPRDHLERIHRLGLPPLSLRSQYGQERQMEEGLYGELAMVVVADTRPRPPMKWRLLILLVVLAGLSLWGYFIATG